MGQVVLLNLVGGVALLLWGLHMVRSGIMRAFGSDLRRYLSTALRNRFIAFLGGVGVTALLQSSTATALMITSFAARGLGRPGAGPRSHCRARAMCFDRRGADLGGPFECGGGAAGHATKPRWSALDKFFRIR